MAIYGWIYANAKLQGARLDYQVRGGYRELSAFCSTTDSVLPAISYRLMSVDERNLKPDLPPAWFAGFLDPEKQYYAVATGATQVQLLDKMVSAGIYRSQFCTLAYVFTGKDIRRYQQDYAMFAPLKQKLLEIQLAEEESERPDDSCLMEIDLTGYEMEKGQSADNTESERYGGAANKYNLFPSTPEKDAWVWRQSLHRPVLTAAPLRQDATKFLDISLFGDGLVTVTGGQEEQYVPISRRTPPPKKVQPPTEKSPGSTTIGTNGGTGVYGGSTDKTPRGKQAGSSTVNRAGGKNGTGVLDKHVSHDGLLGIIAGALDVVTDAATDVAADVATGINNIIIQPGLESVKAVKLKQSFVSTKKPKGGNQTSSYGGQGKISSAPPAVQHGKAAPPPEPKLQTEQQVLAAFREWKSKQGNGYASSGINDLILVEYAHLINKKKQMTRKQMMMALDKAVLEPDLPSVISGLREELFPVQASEFQEIEDDVAPDAANITRDESERNK